MAGPAIGAPFAGGFYAGAIWDQIDTSASSVAVATGPAIFAVSSGNPDIYIGQLLLIAEQGNAGVNYLEAQVTGYAGTTLDVDVLSVAGGGTISNWSIKARWRLIISPKSAEILNTQMATVSTVWPTACVTLTNGKAATDALYAFGSATDYPAAHAVKSLTTNGYSDWYLPARDEFEILYRNFKSTTNTNATSARGQPSGVRTFNLNGNIEDQGGDTQGINRHSYPAGAAYTVSDPPQTSLADFQVGGAEAFSSQAAWNTSTEASDGNYYFQARTNGTQLFQSKTQANGALINHRPIRRELWREYTNGGDFAAASSLGVASGIDVSRDAALPAGANIASTATTDVAGPAEIVGAPTLAAESNADLGGASDIDGAADLAAAATAETSRAAALGGVPDLAAGSTVDQQADAALTASPDLSSAALVDLEALATLPTGAGLNAAGQVTTYIAPQPIPRRTYLVDIEGVDADGELQTVRFSSGRGYTSRAGDDPARGFWQPGLSIVGQVEVNLFAPGAVSGAARSGYGALALVNADGAYDALARWAFDGRACRVRLLPDEEAALASAEPVFTGALQTADFSLASFGWTMRDRLEALRVPLLTERYAGTTTSALAGGVEGNADVKGLVKPLSMGVVENVTAIPVNIFELIYQLSRSALAAIDAVYDRGRALVFDGNDYADAEALEDAEVEAGAYATCLAAGLVKLGATPDGAVTIDATEGDSGGGDLNSAAQVVKRLLLDHAGLDPDELAADSFTALDALNDEDVSLHVDDDRDILDAVSEVLQSVGATLAADRLGRFGVWRVDLPDPSDEPVAIFTADDIEGDLAFQPANTANGGIPPSEIVLRYRRNWTVQSADQLAGLVLECADAQRRQFLTEEWRSVTVPMADTAARHRLARPHEHQSLLQDEAAAQAEAARLATMLSISWPTLALPVPLARAQAVELLDVVEVRHPRYGHAAGLLYTVLGFVWDFDADQAQLTLWGGIEKS